jgi:hypothetical protein
VGPTRHCLNPLDLIVFGLPRSSTARPRAELEKLARLAARQTGGESPDTQARVQQRRRALLNRSSPRGARRARPSRGEARGGARLARLAAEASVAGPWRGPRRSVASVEGVAMASTACASVLVCVPGMAAAARACAFARVCTAGMAAVAWSCASARACVDGVAAVARASTAGVAAAARPSTMELIAWMPIVSSQWRNHRFFPPRCKSRHDFLPKKRCLGFSFSFFVDKCAALNIC